MGLFNNYNSAAKNFFDPMGFGYMGGKKKKDGGGMDFPDAPSFWSDPNVDWSQNTLKAQVPNLLSLSGLPEPLMETINLNPDISRLAMTRLQASMDPYMRNSRQNVVNQLEANNQLTGSTTASSLGNLEADYLSALTAAGAEASIADINRALANRVSLYGTGLNTAQAVGNTALNNQSQYNNFALANYENQIAEVLGNQPVSTGGLMGGLQGAVGGALAGASLTGGNPVGALVGAGLGGYTGYTGSPSAGGSYLSSGAMLAGNRLITSGGSSRNESIMNTQYSPYYQPLTYANVTGGF